MTTTAQLRHARTTSRDGTEIGYFSSGDGPPLLLIHGGLGDHTRWDALRPYLEPQFTVHAMDRRGRGASGDGPEYQLEREFEDVVAVVEAVADRSGSAVAVYGHSYGGLCALGAATLTAGIDKLVLYEGWPPVDPAAWTPPPGSLERLEELMAAGDREAVLETFLREFVKMSGQEIDAYRSQPSWQGRVAAAHTIIREERAFQERAFEPEAVAGITLPTLLMVGEDQTLDWQAETVRDALTDTRIRVLEGQAHTADIVAPEIVADQLLTFLSEQH
jgi:pimeloyl-ACP methyl ester carboxylesterase